MAERGGLFRSTAVVSALTMLSRVLGLIRDAVFAQVFGAGGAMDAFVVAFRIPNLFRRISAEGAFSLAFVPVFNEYKQQRPGELRALTDRVFGTLGLILLVLSALGVLAAPLLILLFAPGFADAPDRYAAAVDMLRLTFPYLLFISLVAAAQGVLNSFGRFAVPAFTPVLLNLCLIGAALLIAPQFGEPTYALAVGVLVAGVAQLLFQLPALRAIALLPRPRWGWSDPGVKRIVALMLPALLGSSAAQINVLVNTVIASYLVAGSVSWLYYSDRLIELPLGVFGVALGTVLLPRLSQLHADADPDGFGRALDWGVRCVLLIGVPALAALVLLAGPLVATLFYRGEFSAYDVDRTAASMAAYACGVPALMLVKVLTPGFYARQDSRTPVRIGIAAIAVNIALTLLLVGPLAHVGLALATALAAYLNSGLLLALLWRRGVFRPQPGWPRFALRLLTATALMAALLVWAGGARAGWLDADTPTRVLRLAALVIAGLAAYLAALWLAGLRPRHLRPPAP